MPTEKMVVVNIKELESALDKIIDNINDAISGGIEIEDLRVPPISIKVSDGIPEHASTITSTMMKSFVGFQNEVNAILEIANGGQLSKQEKKSVELRVRIEEGSTNFIVDLYNLVVAGVPNMSLDQTIIVMGSVLKAVGIICTAGVLTAGVKLYSKERILRIREKEKEQEANARLELRRIESEEKKAELAYRNEQDERIYKERLAQLEKDKENINAIKDVTKSTLNSIEDMVTHSSSAEKYVYRGLAEEAQNAQVSIDGDTFKADQLQELGKITRRPRREQEEYVVNVKGNFKTELISYVEKDVRKVNISGTGDDGEYYSLEALPVSKEALTTELYDLINEGSPLYWNLSVTMKGEKWKSILVVELKKPEDPDDSTD
jgi:hypothetical protein